MTVGYFPPLEACKAPLSGSMKSLLQREGLQVSSSSGVLGSMSKVYDVFSHKEYPSAPGGLT